MIPVVVLQMDPGVKGYRYYIINDNNNNNIGQVLVPRTNGQLNNKDYSKGTEYWFDVAVLRTMPSSLTFSWQDYDWDKTGPTLGTQSFTMPEKPGWTGTKNQPAKSSSNFVNNNINLVLGWELTYSNNQWGGSLVWANTTGQNTVFGGTVSSPQVLTGDTSISLTWYAASVPPS